MTLSASSPSRVTGRCYHEAIAIRRRLAIAPSVGDEPAMSTGLPAATAAAPAGRMATVVAVHAAVVAGSWLFATKLYAIAVELSRQLAWIAIDAALIAGCGWLVHARRDA